MSIPKQDIINVCKVLKFGEENSELFSEEELKTFHKYIGYLSEAYRRHKDDINDEDFQKEFRKTYLDAYNFYSNDPPHYYITLIRLITDENINLTYKVIPEFKDHVKLYSPIIRLARSNSIKFGNTPSEVLNDADLPDTFELYDKDNNELLRNSVLDVITFSKEYGLKGSHEKRLQSSVQAKLIEELGEHSVEIQIQNNITYKKPGSDGVAGEAVDIAICAIDSFALEHPDKTPEEIYKLFQECMIKKLNKWKTTV